jgi:hypothetical protein
MTETLFSFEPIRETPPEWRTEAKGTPNQIVEEMEFSWEWQEAVDAERFWDVQEDAEVQGEALVETPVQETDGVYERHEAWNLSQGLMRAGLKDCSRLVTRKANRADREKPHKKIVLEFPRGVVIGETCPIFGVPSSHSPSTDYKRRVPLTRASGELAYVRPSKSKPIELHAEESHMVDLEGRAAEQSMKEQAIRDLNRSFGAVYATREDFSGEEDLEEVEIQDAATLCQEQSRAVAGDGAVTGDELVDKVKKGRRAIVVSLDALRAAEAEEDAQALFDYGTTAADLRE